MQYYKNKMLNEKLHAIIDRDVVVKSNVSLSKLDIFEFPVKFRNVSGYFWCNDNKLTDLVGCPKSVGGNFSCYSNQ